MQQFDLSLWLQDKSRKVVTRLKKSVQIISIEGKEDIPIVALVEGVAHQYKPNGYHADVITACSNQCLDNGDYDLFFADEEKELTEFDYAVLSIISDHNSHTDSIEAFAKRSSKKLLDLARKELQPEFDKELDDAYKSRDDVVYLEGYDKGKEDARKIPSNPDYETLKNELASYVEDVKNDVDFEEILDYWTDRLYRIAEEIALKDLPKWKKVDSNPPKVQYNLQGKRLYKDAEYYIELSDLETLPKEE